MVSLYGCCSGSYSHAFRPEIVLRISYRIKTKRERRKIRFLYFQLVFHTYLTWHRWGGREWEQEGATKKESYQTAATKYNVSSNNPKQKMKASNNPENLLKFLLNKLRYFDVNWTTNAMVFYIVAAKCTTLNLPKTGFSDEKKPSVRPFPTPPKAWAFFILTDNEYVAISFGGTGF